MFTYVLCLVYSLLVNEPRQTPTCFSFFFFFMSSLLSLLTLPFLVSLLFMLVVVTQTSGVIHPINGGLVPPPLPTTVRALHFCCGEMFQLFLPFVDSRPIVCTHAVLVALFLRFVSPSNLTLLT